MLAIAISVAYILSGVVGVILDYRQPIYDRPEYIRRGDLIRALVAALIWLPMIIIIFLSHRIIQGKDAGILVLFIALSAVGYMLA